MHQFMDIEQMQRFASRICSMSMNLLYRANGEAALRPGAVPVPVLPRRPAPPAPPLPARVP